MIFIIWRGYGILAPVILVDITFILMMIIDSYTHTINYADAHRWIYSIGSLLGAGLCWPIGKYLNSKPGRIVIDEKTGQRIELKKIHSCFFIPFEYWAVIGVIASIVTLFLK